ncbi:autotransporter outer membrane beta-barrel domain-containing protein [Pseudomonas marincola]|uniref:autotransporter outer membrane beta-barrel domain-containing protein n=1 Tax=Pseudomonas marincola TaxID=437900 RepID=UPI001561E238|nr:autotransporter outer membrane beta-barrel domain-containing protein [Pseudomonas marincola]
MSGINYQVADGLTLILDDAGIIVGEGGVSLEADATSTGNLSIEARNFAPFVTTVDGTGLVAIKRGTGDVSVTVTGGSVAITGPTQSQAHAVFARNLGQGNASVEVAGGTLTTEGNSSFGAYARTDNANAGLASALMSGGSIETTGSSASSGVVAEAAGTGGGAVATMTGGSILVRGNSASGLETIVGNGQSIADAITTFSGGKIEAQGNSNGVSARNSGTGSATIHITGGQISATEGNVVRLAMINTNTVGTGNVVIDDGELIGERGGVLSVKSGPGDVAITLNGGSIRTTFAGNAPGIFTRSDRQAGGNDGSLIININGGTIDTVGSSAFGAEALAGSRTSTFINMRGGAVTTEGRGATGLLATHGSQTDVTGSANILMSGGSVTTKDRGADAILASHGGTGTVGAATAIITDGVISTAGLGSNGVSTLITSASNGSTAESRIEGGTVQTTGQRAAGARALNRGAGAAISGLYGGTLTTADSTGHGVIATSEGTGAATANLAGGTATTQGSSAYGVAAEVSNAASSAAATVNATGGTLNTSGALAHGLFATNAGSGNAVVSNQTTITTSGGNADALRAEVTGTGRYSVSATGGLATGGSAGGAGIRGVGAAGGNIDVAQAAVIDGSAGAAGIVAEGGAATITTSGTIRNGITTAAGADVLNWNAGAIDSTINMGDGSDTALVTAAADMSGLLVANGGDDLGIADGAEDELKFLAGTRVVDGSLLTNWERVRLVSGTDLALSGTLATGTGAGLGADGLGFWIEDGSTLRLASTLATVMGDVTNLGTIDLQNSSANNVLTVTNNYRAGSDLLIDTVLGNDNSATDKLVVNGSTAGNTTLTVNNLGGRGALTTNGIQVVQVDGASNGGFLLKGDFVTPDNQQAVVGGAYAYTLHKNSPADPADGDWYLTSQRRPATPITPTLPPAPVDPNNPTAPGTPTDPGSPTSPVTPPAPSEPAPVENLGPRYSPGVPLYEQYAQALLGLATLPTMQQRIGNRYWPVAINQSELAVNTEGLEAEEPSIEDGASWIRVEGSHRRDHYNVSTAKANTESHNWMAQAGIDALLKERDDGSKLFGGLTAHYGGSRTDVDALDGDGNINIRGYGAGLTLTWLKENGFYVDGQAAVTWFDSDLDSDTAERTLTSDNDGKGYAVSIESGKKYVVDNETTLTPQAQLIYSQVDFDSFDDTFGAEVSMDDADSLEARVGISVDRNAAWKDDADKLRRSHVYGITNLYYEFLDGTQVDVADVKFNNRAARMRADVGVGGSYNWNDDKLSLYGEVSVDTSLNNFGDSTGVNGTVGLRVKF